MAKILRKTQKIFGSNAGATGITEYGSPASGTPLYSTDLDNIQTSEWNDGWSAAALAGTEIPTFQDFNAIHYVMSNQMGYLLQDGIPDYDAGTEYYQFSICRKTGTFELYGSLINANIGNALPVQVDDANWKYIGDLSNLATSGISAAYPIGSIYYNKTNATNPSTLLGFGTWVAITDKFIVSRGGTFTATGGAASVSLSSANNGAHSHSMNARYFDSNSGLSGSNFSEPTKISAGAANVSFLDIAVTTAAMNSSGSGTAFDIIPPYQAVYTWERTA